MKSKKAIYLTYADGFSGIYQTQVIDVVKFYNEIGKNIRLVALMSIRNFRTTKKIIKKELPNAIVLPMMPKLSNFLYNKFTLRLLKIFTKFDEVIARGPLATYLSQKVLKNKTIVYDGRGANKEEEREYNILNGEITYEKLSEYEKSAVLNSDFRIAVSQKLVDYWQREFDYNENKHVIIPCMLGSNFENQAYSQETSLKMREKLGFSPEDIILIYSGSIAAWQSFEFLYGFLESQLQSNSQIKVVFLAKPHGIIDQLNKNFPNRVKRLWLNVSEVYQHLIMGDYGMLFREQTVTNQVASPVKFAEYLSAGLKVLISENLGDFTDFVQKNNAGIVITEQNMKPNLSKNEEKERLSALSNTTFSKSSEINAQKYQTV